MIGHPPTRCDEYWASRLDRLILINSILAVTSSSSSPALPHAQSYPAKPIHIVVPFASGGAVDVLARAIGQRVSEQVGQPVIVDNKPGASGNIAPDFVAKSAPDGYTVLIAANGLATNPTLFADLPFNVTRDLAPVVYIGYAPLILVAPKTFAAKTLKDAIAMAKAQPGKLDYASAGSGHFRAPRRGDVQDFRRHRRRARPRTRAGAPAIIDMLGGRISFMMLDPLQAMPHINGDRLHAIAVGSPKRLAAAAQRADVR
jgi:tripartite-type tricarboxylate transporter receptor subunit TctC